MKIIRPLTITDTGSFTRATTGTYYDRLGVLQTAAIDTPRFNYDPNDLISGPILLTEVAATNLAVRSEDLTHGAYTTNSVTVTANSIAAPDGLTTADRVVDIAASDEHYIEQAGLLTTNQLYKTGVFVHAGTATTFKLSVIVVGLSPDTVHVPFTISGGVITAGTPSNAFVTSAEAIPVGGGWYRCVLTYTLTGLVTSHRFRMYPKQSGVYVGDGLTYTYFWGVSCEALRLSSYIPTVASTVTRAADVNTAMLISNVPETDYSVWSATKVYNTGDRILDLTAHVIYESILGTTSTVTITHAAPGVVSWAANGLVVNTPVSFTTTGVLPAPLVAGTAYYVVIDTADTFKVSATVGGGAITTTTDGSGVHTAVASANFNVVPPSATKWLNIGSDNRWRMFDQSITSQTSQANTITVAITPGARVDSVVGLNVSATTGTINVVDPTDGLIYSNAFALTSYSGITDWYEYFYEPITDLTDFADTNLFAGFPNATITISITAAATPAIGGLVVGLAREIGDSEWGAKVSTVDYSVKTQDAFGNYVITPRNFSKRADFSVKVLTTTVDSLENLLAGYRSTPVVYIGSNAGAEQEFASTIIYGFYKDFSIDISYPPLSTCSLQIEGLT